MERKSWREDDGENMKNCGGTNDGGCVSRSMPKSNKKVEKILAVC